MRKLAKLLPAALLVLLLVPAASQAQATRTWVSGVGDDANPCSRTAPCATFGGAAPKTATGGLINVIDPGEFGPITINRSLTIDARRVQATIEAESGDGIVVDAGANDRVVLRGINVSGVNTGGNGLRVKSAKSVLVSDMKFSRFTQNAILFQPSVRRARINVRDSELVDNGGAGVFVTPNGTGPARATVRNNEIEGNACGIAASSFGLAPSPDFTSNCGSLSSGTPGRATITAFRNGISENDYSGVLATGSMAGVRLGDNEVSGNGRGLAYNLDGTLDSFGDNAVFGNDTDGTPTGHVGRM